MENPTLAATGDLSFIGHQKKITFTASDGKSGLREILVTITQDNATHTVFSHSIPQKGVREEAYTVEVPVQGAGLRDGEALLSIAVTDHSFLKNTTRMNVQAAIDTVPPQVSPLNSTNIVNPGGTCVTYYRVSEDSPRSGVVVGEAFYPGYSAEVSGKPAFVSYFALPLDFKSKSSRIAVVAEDRAGNRAQATLPFFIRDKKFRSDKVNISQSFLDQKMPEFAQRYGQQQKTPLEVFLFVNESLREENQKKIQEVCRKTAGRKLWTGTFLRMKNSAPMASFGDARTYLHEGKPVSSSLHLGVDLASTEHAPIEAANAGEVLFTGYLGIYGNTVIIDHGLGLASLYAHLSEIAVREGQPVAPGERLGSSGATGLASGDHLHFSMLVAGQFVNPIEWWDPHWLKDNVDGKAMPDQAPQAKPVQKTRKRGTRR